jgi:hypothetical protein
MLPSKGDMMSGLLYDTRQYLTEEMCRCLLDSKNKSSLEPEFNKFLCRSSLGPAVYLLLGMVATDGSLASSFYPKIALLEDHTLVFVPKYAQVGDGIYHLCPSQVPYVLRSMTAGDGAKLEEKLTEYFGVFKSEHLEA